MNEKNLYLVEFGEAIQVSGTLNWGGGPSIKPIYVVAADYNNAVMKANYYLEAKIEEAMKKSVLTDDGSLKNVTIPELKIIAVKHIDEIIW